MQWVCPHSTGLFHVSSWKLNTIVLCYDRDPQVRTLFPSAKQCKLKWHSIVKIGQSLYREAPGMDPYRPDQATDVPNFFLAGSYTKQDYIDSMEGATLSGRQCAGAILERAKDLAAAAAVAAAAQGVKEKELVA